MFDNREAAEAVPEGGARGRPRPEHQHLDVDRRRRSRAATPPAFPRHSVGYSLGFEGKTEHLPNAEVLTLSTMCGHGMVSQSLAKKMIDWVKEGRRTPEQACSRTDAVLLVRRLQSLARDAAPGRSAGADEVRRWPSTLALRAGHRRSAACGGHRKPAARGRPRVSARSCRRSRPQQLHVDRRQWRSRRLRMPR